MTVDERRRAQLFDRMSEALGDEAAGTMFEMLPPPDRDLATAHDVDRLGVELSGEMSELRGEMSELRGEMSELRGEMSAVRSELISVFREEVHGAFVGQTRIIVFSLVAALAAIAALAVGVG
jgi:hypothetical protein